MTEANKELLHDDDNVGLSVRPEPHQSDASPKDDKGSGASRAQGSSRSGLASLLGEFAVTAIISAVVSVVVFTQLPRLTGSQSNSVSRQMVAVNFDALVRQEIMGLADKVRAGEIKPEQMPAMSKKFTLAMQDKLNEYAKNGKIVVKSESIVTAPDDLEDVTEKIKSELLQDGLMDVRTETQ
jgi:hypothetical protein